MNKKIFLSLGTAITTLIPISVSVACGALEANYGFTKASNYEGNIYASRVGNVDNLLALGYQAKYVNKTFEGAMVEQYLSNFMKPNFTEKLHDRAQWDQTIDGENFVSKNITSAFIMNFQSRLYQALIDANLPKNNIGFSTMGETYIPDEDYRIHGPGDNVAQKRNNWNKDQDLVLFGQARTTSEDNSAKEYVKKLNDSHGQTTFTFDYGANIKEALKVNAESIARITANNDVVARANKINQVFDQRILALKNLAHVNNRNALAIKPNYEATSANEIIDTHFAWDPSVYSFLYSERLGLGYQMPNYHEGNGDIQWLEDDVDGLVLNSAENVKRSFASEVDDLFFLKPNNYQINDDAIKNQLKSLTKTNDIADVHVVSQGSFYQSQFGMIGYFSLMDLYAKEFNISAFETGANHWGWSPILPADLKTSL